MSEWHTLLHNDGYKVLARLSGDTWVLEYMGKLESGAWHSFQHVSLNTDFVDQMFSIQETQRDENVWEELEAIGDTNG
jgi:hypothetical protein